MTDQKVQTINHCPDCAKPLVVERYETDDGETVYGRASDATTEHVTMRTMGGGKSCFDRPLRLARGEIAPKRIVVVEGGDPLS